MADIKNRLTLSSGQFDSRITKSGQKVNQFRTTVLTASNNLNSMITGMRSFGAVLTGIFVTGAMARSLQRLVDFGDQLDKVSQQLGVTVNEFAGLQFAAERSGTSFEKFRTAFARVQKNLLDFKRGTGEARLELEALGFSADNVDQLLEDPLEAFLQVADALSKVGNEGIKGAQGYKIFGESFQLLAPALNGGREGLERLFHEQQRLTGDLTVFSQRSAELKDAFTNLSSAGQGLLAGVFTPLLPVIKALTEATTEWFVELRESGNVESGLTTLRNSLLEINGVLQKGGFLVQTFAVALERLTEGKFTQIETIMKVIETGFDRIDRRTRIEQRLPLLSNLPEDDEDTRAVSAPVTTRALSLGAELSAQATLERLSGEIALQFGRQQEALRRFLDAAELTRRADQANLELSANRRGIPATEAERLAIDKRADLEKLRIQQRFGLLEEELARKAGEIQEKLGQAIVKGIVDAQRQPVVNAERELERERLLAEINEVGLQRFSPSFQARARAQNQQGILQKELEVLEARKEAGEDLSLQIELTTRKIRDLGMTLEDIEVQKAINGFRNLTDGFSNALLEVGTGLARGTREIKEFGQVAKDILATGLISLFQKLLQNMIDSVIESIAATAAGKAVGAGVNALFGAAAAGAQGGVVQAFQIGGRVPGFGVGDTINAKLTPGEGIVSRKGMSILDQLNKGEIPDKFRQGSPSPPPVSVSVELVNPIDPASLRMQPDEVVSIFVNGVRQDGVVRRTIKQAVGT